jgi:hypothetical protein
VCLSNLGIQAYNQTGALSRSHLGLAAGQVRVQGGPVGEAPPPPPQRHLHQQDAADRVAHRLRAPRCDRVAGSQRSTCVRIAH